MECDSQDDLFEQLNRSKTYCFLFFPFDLSRMKKKVGLSTLALKLAEKHEQIKCIYVTFFPFTFKKTILYFF